MLTGGELAADASFADFAALTVAAAAGRFGEGEEHEAAVKAWSAGRGPDTVRGSRVRLSPRPVAY